MSEGITAFPLCWPAGWRRTQSRSAAKFRTGKGGWTEGAGYKSAERVSLSEGLRRVHRELRNLGVSPSSIIVSSDLRLRQDGMPYSSQATARLDQGVAVYWRDGKQQRCMAIDRYDRIADNLAAIAATLEAMRAIERHGGATILDRAFTGFTALPSPEQPWQVLGLSTSTPTRDQVEEAYRRLAMKHHPDRGGDAAEMQRVNRARDLLLEEIQS